MLFKFGFILLAFFFCGYIFYSCSARYLKIKDLPDNIISEGERKKYVSVLQKYVLISGACFVIDILTFLSNVVEIRIILPLIAMFICCYIFMDLSDEIADFDISKKDSIIVTDFLKAQLERAKEHEKENKIKKVDSDSMQKELEESDKDVESEKNKENKENIEDKKEEE